MADGRGIGSGYQASNFLTLTPIVFVTLYRIIKLYKLRESPHL